ncbi:hypothetical protein [Bhargavaea ginsengi]|uniref:hypothetical protein n=1 Tax=Bhargavaea ginsengi TaxID=426757 RepID=UPI003C7228DA
MLKSSLIYGVFMLAGIILSQLIFTRDIEWGMAFGVSFFAFLFNLLWEWAKVPYDWKKRSGH